MQEYVAVLGVVTAGAALGTFLGNAAGYMFTKMDLATDDAMTHLFVMRESDSCTDPVERLFYDYGRKRAIVEYEQQCHNSETAAS